MTKFGNLVARTNLAQRAARGVALAGLGLALLSGGISMATEEEGRKGGEAEAAPAADVKELAAGRLIVASPEREAPMSPARVVAHTAQLPRASGKPTLSVELPKPPPGPIPRATSTPTQPTAEQSNAKPSPANRSGLAATKGGAAGPARRTHLPLAPSASEIRREIAARNGGPLSGAGASSPGASGAAKDKPSAGERLQERATTTPTQNPRWPTHVDYSAGPAGPAGGNTAGDRKGSLIEATGPQQGVIRNRW
jgi:hypothetical protein